MKHCTQLVFALLCLFTTLNSTAQKATDPKPFLFKNYPAVIDCTEAQLAGFFAKGNDVEVSVSLSGDLTLKGPVKWWAKQYSYLQTVSVKLTNFSNILFSVTRRYDSNNNFIYVGHLMSPDFADGYELKRSGDNNYRLVKVATEEILQICSRQK